MSAVQINLPLEDDQTAQQVPMTAISADAAHVAVNTTDVQAGLLILAEYMKDRPTFDNFQNGLTKVGTKIELGGGILHDTIINISDKFLAFLGKEVFFSETWGKTNFTHAGISFKSTYYNTSNPNNDFGMGFIQSVFGKNYKIDPITDRAIIEMGWLNDPSVPTSRSEERRVGKEC